ncbi:hypothetical protein [Chryseolinea lacunae]|uniref:Uncharacterized protein n=1 Tax=Chryseolinea lacunae TaxID=2801331 RepID=A0ABS1L1L5_9BACT|nr:hypothetical protein [Chryseolinea lacunae]MBL0745604.1 hypothetical protein [Chryseolinea lacunae]
MSKIWNWFRSIVVNDATFDLEQRRLNWVYIPWELRGVVNDGSISRQCYVFDGANFTATTPPTGMRIPPGGSQRVYPFIITPPGRDRQHTLATEVHRAVATTVQVAAPQRGTTLCLMPGGSVTQASCPSVFPTPHRLTPASKSAPMKIPSDGKKYQFEQQG